LRLLNVACDLLKEETPKQKKKKEKRFSFPSLAQERARFGDQRSNIRSTASTRRPNRRRPVAGAVAQTVVSSLAFYVA